MDYDGQLGRFASRRKKKKIEGQVRRKKDGEISFIPLKQLINIILNCLQQLLHNCQKCFKVPSLYLHPNLFILYFMHQLQQLANKFMQTPVKIKKLEEPETQYTRSPGPNNRKLAFDYKQKIFDLINENTELKIQVQSLRSEKASLEQKVFSLETQIKEYLNQINCSNLPQAVQIFRERSLWVAQEHGFPNKKEEQVSIAQKITKLNKDHFRQSIDKNMRQLQSRWAINYESMKHQLAIKQKSIFNLEKDCKNLKQQNLGLQKRNENLKQDLNLSIHKYEQLETLIDEKMKFYIQKLQEYQEAISNISRNKEIAITHNRKQFSFCKDSDDQDLHNVNEILAIKTGSSAIYRQPEASDVDDVNRNSIGKEEQEELMNAQCYRASIEGLLEQNKRLKASFQNLYKTKQGEQIADELLKQINIMKSIIQLNETI